MSPEKPSPAGDGGVTIGERPMSETFEARVLRNLRERHESQISENAGRIRDHLGYVLKRVEAGRADSTGMYAEDIAASLNADNPGQSPRRPRSAAGHWRTGAATPLSGGAPRLSAPG